MSSRASQQDAVYRAEARLPAGLPLAGESGLRALCDLMTEAHWWPEHIPYLAADVVPGRSFSVGGVLDDGGGQIEMLPQHLTVRTVCHEVAHVWADSLCAPGERAAHGPLFVRRYLTLVYWVLGSETYVALRESLLEEGVDIGEDLDI